MTHDISFSYMSTELILCCWIIRPMKNYNEHILPVHFKYLRKTKQRVIVHVKNRIVFKGVRIA